MAVHKAVRALAQQHHLTLMAMVAGAGCSADHHAAHAEPDITTAAMGEQAP
jgi:hypothetical protein